MPDISVYGEALNLFSVKTWSWVQSHQVTLKFIFVFCSRSLSVEGTVNLLVGAVCSLVDVLTWVCSEGAVCLSAGVIGDLSGIIISDVPTLAINKKSTNKGSGRMPKGTDDPIATYNRYESMECVDGDESSDSEVFVSPDTVAALQAQIKPGRHKNS